MTTLISVFAVLFLMGLSWNEGNREGSRNGWAAAWRRARGGKH